jgi:hypothetical protein
LQPWVMQLRHVVTDVGDLGVRLWLLTRVHDYFFTLRHKRWWSLMLCS